MPRRPTPTAIKKVVGHGHRPLSDAEPEVILGKPKRPRFLKGLARRAWKEATAELDRMGVLATIEGSALAAYCQCYARWVQAELDIDEHGFKITITKEDEAGRPYVANVIKNPACTEAIARLKELRAYCVEFGLTPASRTRIRATPARKSVRDQRAESYFNESAPESSRSLFQ